MTARAWSLQDVLATRPAVRVNQLGYLPHGPKRATWVGDEVQPVDFTVQDAEGAVLFAGRSVPWPQRPEPTSGLSVHVLDFTAMTAQPGVCQVVVQGRPSHPFRIAAGL